MDVYGDLEVKNEEHKNLDVHLDLDLQCGDTNYVNIMYGNKNVYVYMKWAILTK